MSNLTSFFSRHRLHLHGSLLLCTNGQCWEAILIRTWNLERSSFPCIFFGSMTNLKDLIVRVKNDILPKFRSAYGIPQYFPSNFLSQDCTLVSLVSSNTSRSIHQKFWSICRLIENTTTHWSTYFYSLTWGLLESTFLLDQSVIRSTWTCSINQQGHKTTLMNHLSLNQSSCQWMGFF